MAPSFDATCDFHKALHELQHCLAYKAKSSDTTMHTSAWVRSVYISWHCLQLAWLSEEEGFIDDEAWWGLEEQLWVLLSSVDVDLVGNSCEEYEFLGNEATKSGIHIPSLPDSSVAHEFSVSESEVVASLVLLSVPVGGESGSEFELPNSLRLSPIACTRCMASLRVNNTDQFWDKYGLQPVPSSSELRRRVRALSPEIDVSPSKRAHTTKGKKDKKDQGGSKDAHMGGLREPIPKNAMEVVESRLQPIGLLVSDKDFGDYMSCNGFYFARPLGELVGHLMQESCDTCHCVEQVFDPSTALADSISHDLKVLLDNANKLLDLSTFIKCSILHQHVQALWSLAELIEQGMCLSHEAEEKDHGDEESEAE
ncbi:hypothetical protein IW262DRAFT_1295700 [Armillaria fumosa]|nr:hypothetical protein IW262DRAFT_1295700 [Armillaria fumosa]